jgi:hypothetical protein
MEVGRLSGPRRTPAIRTGRFTVRSGPCGRPRAGPIAWLLGTCLLIGIAGCSRSHLASPEVAGPIALVDAAGTPRLWALTRQEEVRTATVGFSSRSGGTRDDTVFHFAIEAFDPASARPAWKRRLVTLGDPQAQGPRPSRVIGSSADGRLLGQDADVVWLLIDDQPLAVRVADGSVVADASIIEQRNPGLKGRLPREARYYGFDNGLVLMSADARRLVIRGPQLQAIPYVPTPAPAAAPERMANGRERIVPLRPPIGEAPARQVVLGGRWLGLYSEREAADLAGDLFGDKVRYPYSVLDEGAQVRRAFWRGRIVAARRFDDAFERVVDLAPIADAPAFIRGRFVEDGTTGKPMRLDAPAGLLVRHSTRIDVEGRLALTRLDSDLRPRWTAELPLSDSSIRTPVRQWQLPGRIVLAGIREHVENGRTAREPHLVTVRLSDGVWQAWNLRRAAAVE